MYIHALNGELHHILINLSAGIYEITLLMIMIVHILHLSLVEEPDLISSFL